MAGRPGFSSPAAQHDFDTEEDRRSDLRTDCDQALIALAVVVLAYGYVRYAIAVWPQVMRIGMSNPALLAVSMAETVAKLLGAVLLVWTLVMIPRGSQAAAGSASPVCCSCWG